MLFRSLLAFDIGNSNIVFGVFKGEELITNWRIETYKTIALAEAATKLKQKGEQVFYIGCRNCGHCLNLEKVMKQFLDKHKDKNVNRDLIQKIEAGYSCIPEKNSEDYKGYEQVYQFLVDAGVTEANEEKRFWYASFLLN